MPNIASILKSEISRVARKEVRAEAGTLKKASSQYRTAIAALRRQVADLEKEVRRLSKVAGKSAAPSEQSSSDLHVQRRRFSAARLAAHRTKVQLSAASYGKLMGLSGQTVYNWEQGKSRPTPSQILQLAAIKELSKADLTQKLQETAG